MYLTMILIMGGVYLVAAVVFVTVAVAMGLYVLGRAAARRIRGRGEADAA